VKKNWVFKYFPRKLAGEKLSSSENFGFKIMTLRKQLKNKQTDPRDAFVENARQS